MRTQSLCVSAAVLYQLSYEDPCVGSRQWSSSLPVTGMKREMELIWTAGIQMKLRCDVIVKDMLSNITKINCVLIRKAKLKWFRIQNFRKIAEIKCRKNTRTSKSGNTRVATISCNKVVSFIDTYAPYFRNRKHVPCFFRVTQTRFLSNQLVYFLRAVF